MLYTCSISGIYLMLYTKLSRLFSPPLVGVKRGGFESMAAEVAACLPRPVVTFGIGLAAGALGTLVTNPGIESCLI